jgi:hypothetical protein
MDPDAFGAISEQIASSLKDKSESCLEKRSDARIEQLIAHVNIEKPPNARERKTGCCVAPRLLGLVPFSEVRKDRHKVCLELELAARSIEFDQTENFTNRMKKLKTAKTNRLSIERPSTDPKNQDKKHFKTVSPTAVFECLEFEQDEEGMNDWTRSRLSFELQAHISSAD